MSQHDLRTVTRGAVIAELACLSEQVADVYTDIIKATARHGLILSRISTLQHLLAASVAMPEAADPAKALVQAVEKTLDKIRPAQPVPQAATPARIPPAVQDEGQPESARKAPDDVSERGVGGDTAAGQSGESRHVAGAGGESAASADTAPVADEKKPKRVFPNPLPADDPRKAAAAEPAPAPIEPLIPRRPAQVVPGNGQVQDGGPISRSDQVLDLWATTLLTYAEIAAKLKINPNTPSAYVSTARSKCDPRAKQGDEPRETIRYDRAMDAYASSNDAPSQIDRKLGLPAGLTQKLVTQAWGNGDQRVKDGDAKRRPAATARVEAIAQDRLAIPAEKLLVADVKGCRVVGPAGDWAAPESVVKAIRVLDDGQLYGLKTIAEKSGISEGRVAHAIPLWTSCLRKIGIALVHTPHIGCKLNRIAA